MNKPEEYVEESSGSDESIGRAFAWSLTALLVAGTAFSVFWLWPAPKQPPQVVTNQTSSIKELPSFEMPLPNIAFRDVAADCGIDFVHFSGANGDRLLPETMGGGVAIFDFDNNNLPDLLFVSGMEWPGDSSDPKKRRQLGSSLRLFANQGNWKFQDITESAGLSTKLCGMGCAVGDYNNDGWLDLFVTCVGENRLYQNLSGKFQDQTAAAGVGGAADAWSSSAGFFDYDRDGLLDLLVCNYVKWSRKIDFELNFTLNGTDRAYGPPTNYEGTQPFLYHNLGAGKFEEVAATAGLHVLNSVRPVPEGKALGIVLADCDGDGWEDVIVANDKVRNYLFRNQQNGTFAEQGIPAGIAYDRAGASTGAMGIDLGYIFNDRTQAVAVGNFANEMTSVYVSQPDGSFVDEAATLGIGGPSRQRLKFGALWLDLDLDSRLDLVEANGHIEDSIATVQPSQTYRQPAQLFWNKGSGRGLCFVELPKSLVGDLSREVVGRGLASGDLDQDGDLDLVLTQIDGPALVLRNEQSSGHAFLSVKLKGNRSNRFGFGARVQIQLGEQLLTRFASPTRSYLSQIEPTVHFGLGSAQSVRKLTVHWPSGATSELHDLPTNQVLTVEEPK